MVTPTGTVPASIAMQTSNLDCDVIVLGAQPATAAYHQPGADKAFTVLCLECHPDQHQGSTSSRVSWLPARVPPAFETFLELEADRFLVSALPHATVTPMQQEHGLTWQVVSNHSLDKEQLVITAKALLLCTGDAVDVACVLQQDVRHVPGLDMLKSLGVELRVPAAAEQRPAAACRSTWYMSVAGAVRQPAAAAGPVAEGRIRTAMDEGKRRLHVSWEPVTEDDAPATTAHGGPLGEGKRRSGEVRAADPPAAPAQEPWHASANAPDLHGPAPYAPGADPKWQPAGSAAQAALPDTTVPVRIVEKGGSFAFGDRLKAFGSFIRRWSGEMSRGSSFDRSSTRDSMDQPSGGNARGFPSWGRSHGHASGSVASTSSTIGPIRTATVAELRTRGRGGSLDTAPGRSSSNIGGSFEYPSSRISADSSRPSPHGAMANHWLAPGEGSNASDSSGHSLAQVRESDTDDLSPTGSQTGARQLSAPAGQEVPVDVAVVAAAATVVSPATSSRQRTSSPPRELASGSEVQSEPTFSKLGEGALLPPHRHSPPGSQHTPVEQAPALGAAPQLVDFPFPPTGAFMMPGGRSSHARGTQSGDHLSRSSDQAHGVSDNTRSAFNISMDEWIEEEGGKPSGGLPGTTGLQYCVAQPGVMALGQGMPGEAGGWPLAATHIGMQHQHMFEWHAPAAGSAMRVHPHVARSMLMGMEEAGHGDVLPMITEDARGEKQSASSGNAGSVVQGHGVKSSSSEHVFSFYDSHGHQPPKPYLQNLPEQDEPTPGTLYVLGTAAGHSHTLLRDDYSVTSNVLQNCELGGALIDQVLDGTLESGRLRRLSGRIVSGMTADLMVGEEMSHSMELHGLSVSQRLDKAAHTSGVGLFGTYNSVTSLVLSQLRDGGGGGVGDGELGVAGVTGGLRRLSGRVYTGADDISLSGDQLLGHLMRPADEYSVTSNVLQNVGGMEQRWGMTETAFRRLTGRVELDRFGHSHSYGRFAVHMSLDSNLVTDLGGAVSVRSAVYTPLVSALIGARRQRDARMQHGRRRSWLADPGRTVVAQGHGGHPHMLSRFSDGGTHDIAAPVHGHGGQHVPRAGLDTGMSVMDVVIPMQSLSLRQQQEDTAQPMASPFVTAGSLAVSGRSAVITSRVAAAAQKLGASGAASDTWDEEEFHTCPNTPTHVSEEAAAQLDMQPALPEEGPVAHRASVEEDHAEPSLEHLLMSDYVRLLQDLGMLPDRLAVDAAHTSSWDPDAVEGGPTFVLPSMPVIHTDKSADRRWLDGHTLSGDDYDNDMDSPGHASGRMVRTVMTDMPHAVLQRLTGQVQHSNPANVPLQGSTSGLQRLTARVVPSGSNTPPYATPLGQHAGSTPSAAGHHTAGVGGADVEPYPRSGSPWRHQGAVSGPLAGVQPGLRRLSGRLMPSGSNSVVVPVGPPATTVSGMFTTHAHQAPSDTGTGIAQGAYDQQDLRRLQGRVVPSGSNNVLPVLPTPQHPLQRLTGRVMPSGSNALAVDLGHIVPVPAQLAGPTSSSLSLGTRTDTADWEPEEGTMVAGTLTQFNPGALMQQQALQQQQMASRQAAAQQPPAAPRSVKSGPLQVQPAQPTTGLYEAEGWDLDTWDVMNHFHSHLCSALLDRAPVKETLAELVALSDRLRVPQGVAGSRSSSDIANSGASLVQFDPLLLALLQSDIAALPDRLAAALAPFAPGLSVPGSTPSRSVSPMTAPTTGSERVDATACSSKAASHSTSPRDISPSSVSPTHTTGAVPAVAQDLGRLGGSMPAAHAPRAGLAQSASIAVAPLDIPASTGAPSPPQSTAASFTVLMQDLSQLTHRLTAKLPHLGSSVATSRSASRPRTPGRQTARHVVRASWDAADAVGDYAQLYATAPSRSSTHQSESVTTRQGTEGLSGAGTALPAGSWVDEVLTRLLLLDLDGLPERLLAQCDSSPAAQPPAAATSMPQAQPRRTSRLATSHSASAMPRSRMHLDGLGRAPRSAVVSGELRPQPPASTRSAMSSFTQPAAANPHEVYQELLARLLLAAEKDIHRLAETLSRSMSPQPRDREGVQAQRASRHNSPAILSGRSSMSDIYVLHRLAGRVAPTRTASNADVAGLDSCGFTAPPAMARMLHPHASVGAAGMYRGGGMQLQRPRTAGETRLGRRYQSHGGLSGDLFDTAAARDAIRVTRTASAVNSSSMAVSGTRSSMDVSLHAWSHAGLGTRGLGATQRGSGQGFAGVMIQSWGREEEAPSSNEDAGFRMLSSAFRSHPGPSGLSQPEDGSQAGGLLDTAASGRLSGAMVGTAQWHTTLASNNSLSVMLRRLSGRVIDSHAPSPAPSRLASCTHMSTPNVQSLWE